MKRKGIARLHSDCFRGGGICGGLHPYTDVFYGSISAVKTHHLNDGHLKRDGILERFPAAVSGIDRQKTADITVIYI